MILTIKNIGKLAEASIDLKGITVIAGENDTGKSTLGKVLFCIFNSFYKIDQQIYSERQDIVARILWSDYHGNTGMLSRRLDTDDMAEHILQKNEEYINNKELLKKDIRDLYLQGDENFDKNINSLFLDDMSEKVFSILKIADEEVFKTVLQKKLESEFSGQINNIYFPNEEGRIELQIKDSIVCVLIKNDEVTQIEKSFSLETEVIYIDDPFAVDDLRHPMFLRRNYVAHREHLKSLLITNNTESNVKEAFEEIIVTKKMNTIFEKINTVCNGELIQTTRRGEFGYKKKNVDAVLDIKNISTGLKTFVILKTLLLNGNLEENGTIILDEPEIHLHPEWQLLFAELIVLIQKEFGMHILLNTHSPYFLNAIEVYAAKYEIADKCRYYLAENNGPKAIVLDVSNNIEKIYKKLARPLQDLENERYHNE